MAWTQPLLLVSLIVLLVGIVLMIRQITRRVRELVRGERRIVEETADMACQSLFLGALALMQLSQLVGHVGEGALPPDPWLSLTASTGIFVLFGLSLGRLMLRWQLRHVLSERATGKQRVTDLG